jgi:WD40 repeat protein
MPCRKTPSPTPNDPHKVVKRLLMIDWDLEAPGLHRYFEDSLKKALRTAQRSGIRSLALQPGLIDFFESTDSGYSKDVPSQIADELETARAKSRSQAFASFPAHVLATDFDNLYFLKAGRFDDEYPERIRKFDWERFHRQDPGFFREFRHFLMEHYDYVLIDSRTGLTDTSGICVQQMPEKLVLVFVPNNQNIDGVLDVVRRVRRFRVGSSDLRPLVSFPLASRIDGTNERLRVAWRNGGKLDGDEVPGYQKVFEDLFEDLYELDECNLTAYFDATQIQHDSDYAYGEKIAARRGTTDRLSLGYAFANFTQRLTTLSVPWESLPEEHEIETAKRRELAASAREETAHWRVKLITVISATITLLALVVGFAVSHREYAKSRATAVLAAVNAASDPLEQALLLTELEDSSAPAGGVELARQLASTPIPALVLRGHTGPIVDVSFSPDGSRIATASADQTARIWNADGTGEPLIDSSSPGPLATVAWSPDQKSLLTTCESTVRTWDLRTGRVDTVVSLKSPPLIAASFNPAGQLLVVDRYGVLHILGTTSGETISTLLNPEYIKVLNAQFGMNGTIVGVSSSNGTTVLNLGPVVRLTRFPQATKLPDDLPVNAIAFSPDGLYLVTSTAAGTNLWNLLQNRQYKVLRSNRDGPVEAMKFSPDGGLLAVAGSDGTTSVYNASARPTFPAQAIAVLRGHVGVVRSLAVSPDSKLLATASDDKTVRLWNLAWQPPSSGLDWTGLLRYLRAETKVCLSAEQRSRLLSETSKEAYEKYAACEKHYGRKALPQTTTSKTIP